MKLRGNEGECLFAITMVLCDGNAAATWHKQQQQQHALYKSAPLYSFCTMFNMQVISRHGLPFVLIVHNCTASGVADALAFLRKGMA